MLITQPTSLTSCHHNHSYFIILYHLFSYLHILLLIYVLQLLIFHQWVYLIMHFLFTNSIYLLSQLTQPFNLFIINPFHLINQSLQLITRTFFQYLHQMSLIIPYQHLLQLFLYLIPFLHFIFYYSQTDIYLH